ncbi:hypothetical protein DXX93_14620 [Thalassotalea euphylliae]|uniref:HPF/RaiA family ribosome-associated protein n=1 Tax=Thalassotalea euphylliae TaxID=1655234 RepID=A0A3E0TTJ7_9GAMM|nr:hypothetical protein [Thalassotalea euphylliae]REL27667.1 hypothetical protein DXX93_14620 [Thalassotalea euphylliae]
MKCFIHANNVQLTRGFRAQIANRIKSALCRVEAKVKFVVVSFQDINGLRGGKDKQCKLKIVVDGVSNVQIVDAQSTPQAAFGLALGRSKRALTERIKKPMRHYKKARSKVREDMTELTAEPA